MNVPIMRSPKGCYDMIHISDPDSTVSEHYIRQVVATGKVKSVRAGRRILVNYDSLLDHLTSPMPFSDEPDIGKIRPVRAS